MLTIHVYTEFESKKDLCKALDHLIELIEAGYTNGGGWTILGNEPKKGEGETNNDDN